MKRILHGGFCAALLAVSASAQNYFTKSSSGTTACQVNFPAIAGSQGRLASAVATSDKAASVLSCRTGVAAYSVTVTTNAASANVFVNTTNGVTPSDLFILQKADGTLTNCTVTAPTGYSNITFSAALGVIPAAGDTLYKLGAATTIKVGATTVVYGSDALYAGNRGRPIRILLDGTSACSLDSITVKQD